MLALLLLYIFAKNSKFSFTVRLFATDVSCGDISIISLILSISLSKLKLFIIIVPLVLFVKPQRILIRVVFPAPFTPKSPNNSPSLIVRETLSNAFLVL